MLFSTPWLEIVVPGRRGTKLSLFSSWHRFIPTCLVCHHSNGLCLCAVCVCICAGTLLLGRLGEGRKY